MHRWLIWGGAWLLPLGYGLVALRPELRVAGLHVVFVGCFALLALVARLLMSVAPANTWLWLGCAAGAFLVATGLWVVFLGPLARGAPTPGS